MCVETGKRSVFVSKTGRCPPHAHRPLHSFIHRSIHPFIHSHTRVSRHVHMPPAQKLLRHIQEPAVGPEAAEGGREPRRLVQEHRGALELLLEAVHPAWGVVARATGRSRSKVIVASSTRQSCMSCRALVLPLVEAQSFAEVGDLAGLVQLTGQDIHLF